MVAPISYASFGEPVAPGQVDIEELCNRYNGLTMSRQSRFVALLGQPEQVETYKYSSAKTAGADQTIYLAFSASDKQELESLKRKLNINEIIEL